ncbi:MAG: class I SAM-dependent methyltransferase, partial [Candidatus Thermochlorobacter sp.]
MQLRTLTAGIDTNIRYLPVLHELQQLPHYTTLLEVGSGSEGIARYVEHLVVGADVHFPTPPLPNLHPIVLSSVTLPFENRSFDVVVSTDTLEHIVPHQRATMVSELIRVAKQRVFLAVPIGERAAEHDRKLDALYAQKHGKRHPFLIEHVEYGLPTLQQMQTYLMHALHVHQRRA